ncbi:MAG: hypothetical protein JXK07_11365 [Spirochaetes bacterium]|nr:hypothetical protein [Spirochaetota bacterium]MBN2770866.1 hypothetical protein [Spirochaetota bacterium]
MKTGFKKFILVLLSLLLGVSINSCGPLNDIDIKRDYPKQFDPIEYSDDILVLPFVEDKLVAINSVTAEQVAVYDFTTKNHFVNGFVHYKKHCYLIIEDDKNCEYALLVRLNLETGKVDEIDYYNIFPEIDSHAKNYLLIGSPLGGSDTMLYDMETGKKERKKTYSSWGKSLTLSKEILYVIDNTDKGYDEVSWISYTNDTRVTYKNTEYISDLIGNTSENYVMMIQSNKRNQELKDNTIAIVGPDNNTGSERLKYYKIIDFENKELELIYDFVDQGDYVYVSYGVVLGDYAYLANDFDRSFIKLYKVNMTTKNIVANITLPANFSLIYKNGYFWLSDDWSYPDDGNIYYYRVNPEDMSVVKFKIDESK